MNEKITRKRIFLRQRASVVTQTKTEKKKVLWKVPTVRINDEVFLTSTENDFIRIENNDVLKH
jgi:hypothetical protein